MSNNWNEIYSKVTAGIKQKIAPKKHWNVAIVIGKLKSPVSKVSFCYLKNNSEIDIEALGIGGVICKCKSKDNCNDQLYK